ncbi:MAG: glutathione S-transferase family protein [Proteobacteria bacterium]|nr:glutathione S-transferase family protein [Pseudomonadota bacterium]MBI3499067.1 glutathione S-transferase family protein [Pseudomonadota bacterium]
MSPPDAPRPPNLFGAAYSVYVRIVRLALEEKGVPYDLEEVDIFAPSGVPSAYLDRHPFGRIPAFEHQGFRLYETNAITRYVDAAFPGPPLQPRGIRERARMDQIVSVLDNYAYRTLVWDIFVERVRLPQQGRVSDEEKIRAALPRAKACFEALDRLREEHPFLAGPELSLADLYAAPMLAYFAKAPEGAALLLKFPHLSRWWEQIRQRPSMAATRSSLE